MESYLKEVIWKFWEDPSLIRPTHFVFVSISSDENQLLKYLADITSALNENKWVDVVYLDFSQASNTIPHVRLLSKLSALGIKGNLLGWFCP